MNIAMIISLTMLGVGMLGSEFEKNKKFKIKDNESKKYRQNILDN